MNEEMKPEENFLQDADTEEVPIEASVEASIEASTENTKVKKRMRWDFYFEVILFFVLGALVGIAVKTEAAKRITIGFDDYKMNIIREDYDINKLQADLEQKQQQEAQNNSTSSSASQGQVQGAQPDGQANQDNQNSQSNQTNGTNVTNQNNN